MQSDNDPDQQPEPQPRQRRNNRRHRKDGMKFGDEDFSLSIVDDYDEAEWGEVYKACCSHSLQEIGLIFLGILGLFVCLYFWIFAMDLLGTGSKVISGCRGGELFGSHVNPLSMVMIAVLCTALLQSSSTTTSLVVALVSDGAISVEDGIYLIMGANIGTTITNDIVALAQAYPNNEEFERAFAAATLHDLFNILTVLVLLPFEVWTGYLRVVTQLIVDGAETKAGDGWEGPVDKWVKPLTQTLIIASKKATLKVAEGESCHDFYPTTCMEGMPQSKETCETGFVACADDFCPAWFRTNATLQDDMVAGGVTVVMGLLFVWITTVAMMAIAQWMLKGLSTRVVYKVVNVNGYLGIALGTGLTMLLQSSSLTTSLLTPWVGIGVIRLEQMYPLTLGANIGTTLSAIFSALVVAGLEPLQVALAHLFFNITGVLIWYPIPHLRRVPIYLARQVGKMVLVWRFFAVIWIVGVFFVVPLILIGISDLFHDGQTAGGALCVTAICVIVLGSTYWLRYMGGSIKVAIFFDNCSQWGHREVSPAGGGTMDDAEEEDDDEEEEGAAAAEDNVNEDVVENRDNLEASKRFEKEMDC